MPKNTLKKRRRYSRKTRTSKNSKRLGRNERKQRITDPNGGGESTVENGWDKIELGNNTIGDKILTIEEIGQFTVRTKPVFVFSLVKKEEKDKDLYSTYKLVSKNNNIKHSFTAYEKFITLLMNCQYQAKNSIAQDGFSVIYDTPKLTMYAIDFFRKTYLVTMEIELTFKNNNLERITLKRVIYDDDRKPETLTIYIDQAKPIDFEQFIDTFRNAGISISDGNTFKESTPFSSSLNALSSFFTKNKR